MDQERMNCFTSEFGRREFVSGSTNKEFTERDAQLFECCMCRQRENFLREDYLFLNKDFLNMVEDCKMFCKKIVEISDDELVGNYAVTIDSCLDKLKNIYIEEKVTDYCNSMNVVV